MWRVIRERGSGPRPIAGAPRSPLCDARPACGVAQNVRQKTCFWSRLERACALRTLELRSFLIAAHQLETASRVISGWRLVIHDLATVIRDSSPATRERREAQTDHRVTALSAAGNDASLSAVSEFGFSTLLALGQRGNSCSSEQTWDRNGTEPVSTGRQ